MATRDQPRDGEFVLRLAVLAPVSTIEDRFHSCPEFPCDERLVSPSIRLVLPDEVPDVHFDSQDAVDRGPGKTSLPSRRGQSHVKGHFGSLLDCVVACGVPLKGTDNEGADARVGLDRALIVFPDYIKVAARGEGEPKALLRLLQQQPLAGLFREVVDVKHSDDLPNSTPYFPQSSWDDRVSATASNAARPSPFRSRSATCR